MKANLDHVLRLIDQAQGSGEMWGGERLWGAKQDLICMHEFPIQGFQPWTAQGAERDRVRAARTRSRGHRRSARSGTAATSPSAAMRSEKDWPDHVINMSVIVGPRRQHRLEAVEGAQHPRPVRRGRADRHDGL
jgi:hypothetical protein